MIKDCPKCGQENTDNWPLRINGEIKEGGCQECWETQSSEAWWEMIAQIGETIKRIGKLLKTKEVKP